MIDEVLEATDEETPVSVIDIAAAEESLRKLRYWNGELASAEAHASAERFRVDSWLKDQRAAFDERISWHESLCRAYLDITGKKSVDLINGSIKKVEGRGSVVVLNLEEAIAWAKEQGKEELFIRRKEVVEVNKTEVQKYVKDGGEVPLGTDYVYGEDTYKVTVK